MSGAVETDDTQRRLAQATWLIRVVAKMMTEHADGTAHLVLPAAMVRRIKDHAANKPWDT